MKVRAGVAGLVVAASLLVTACGSTLQASGAAAQITSLLEHDYGLASVSVHCPAGVHAAHGSHFTCRARAGGQSFAVQASVLDGRGDFTAAPAAGVVIVARAEAAIAADLSNVTDNHAMVSCGPEQVLVVAAGSSFRCRAVEDGVARDVTVQVGAGGALRYSLGPGLGRVLPAQAS